MFDNLNWKQVKITEAISINPRESLQKGTIAKKVSMSDIIENTKNIENYTLEEYKGGTKFRQNDTLFARITPSLENGKTAKVNILKDNELGFGSTEFIVMRSKPDITNEEFVYYLARWEGIRDPAIKSMTGTSGRQRVQNAIFENLVIKLPPLSEQKQIANILSSFDDKIENNNAIIANLEEQAQVIFKSWFVDFEPFQDEKFIDSELGRIPRDWSIENLGNVINLFDSKRIPLSQMNRQSMDKNYPYYGANGVIDHVESYLFDGKYLLLGEDGTVQTDEGYPILNYINEKFWVSNHAHIMTGKKISTEFLYCSLKRRNIKNIITGAVQQKINQRNLRSIQLIIPTENILNEFQNLIEPMYKQILLLKNYNKKLEEIRDTLLPKLMSGEIHVGDVEIEKVVESKI